MSIFRANMSIFRAKLSTLCHFVHLVSQKRRAGARLVEHNVITNDLSNW